MAEPTHAENMVAKYEQMLLDSAGLSTVTVDGNSVAYSQLEKSHQHWKRVVAREQGKRPVSANINLGGF